MDDAASAAARIRNSPNMEVQADTPFWRVTLPDEVFEAGEHSQRNLKRTFSGWAFQRVIHAFRFDHLRAGRHLCCFGAR
jgi:hypothetical protein